MSRWPTKAKIYNRELQRLLDEGVEEPEASRLASERTEEIFGDMCDQAYEEHRDREEDRFFGK